ncbi:hypothetical protein BDZ97DRAFT_1916998 [Flammula alnicola]|nr:hypothetical protein BDZ97DRAFT_1916998 [Flammula alnicola]
MSVVELLFPSTCLMDSRNNNPPANDACIAGMAHARDGEHGQLISNSSGRPPSQKSGISTQIGEAQGSSLQPGNSRLEVTVLRAHRLPRLKTLFGKKRRFYVTVTDGTIAKKTEAIRSVEQAMQWNEKLDAL